MTKPVVMPYNDYADLVEYAAAHPTVKTLSLPNTEFIALTLRFAPDLHAKVVREDREGIFISVGRLKVRPK